MRVRGAGVGSGTPPIPAVSREVVVSILSACSGRSRAEFFRVSIPESGQLTYSGIQLTRQLGTKNMVATASQVEAISSAAKLFLAGGSRRGTRAEPGLETDDYCVEVREVGGGRTKVVRSMFLYDRRPEIVTLIDAVLLENRLVCPGPDLHQETETEYVLPRLPQAAHSLGRVGSGHVFKLPHSGRLRGRYGLLQRAAFP